MICCRQAWILNNVSACTLPVRSAALERCGDAPSPTALHGVKHDVHEVNTTLKFIRIAISKAPPYLRAKPISLNSLWDWNVDPFSIKLHIYLLKASSAKNPGATLHRSVRAPPTPAIRATADPCHLRAPLTYS